MPYIGTCFRFYMQMRVQKNNKAFAYRIYSHFTQQCPFQTSCPRTYWMPPCSKNSDRPQKDTLQKQMFQASGNICLLEYRKCFHIPILLMTVWAFFTSKYNCMWQRSTQELFEECYENKYSPKIPLRIALGTLGTQIEVCPE